MDILDDKISKDSKINFVQAKGVITNKVELRIRF